MRHGVIVVLEVEHSVICHYKYIGSLISGLPLTESTVCQERKH